MTFARRWPQAQRALDRRKSWRPRRQKRMLQSGERRLTVERLMSDWIDDSVHWRIKFAQRPGEGAD
jgi:hypothetical protein